MGMFKQKQERNYEKVKMEKATVSTSYLLF